MTLGSFRRLWPLRAGAGTGPGLSRWQQNGPRTSATERTGKGHDMKLEGERPPEPGTLSNEPVDPPRRPTIMDDLQAVLRRVENEVGSSRQRGHVEDHIRAAMGWLSKT